ncbi:branched-chain amino acid ABC transporter permease (plasmid) [Diaphorobacter sp. HDW4B]|uniref:branched-chain amino acid ABC transporter permease n=1 Tax=Diaphorobacter sp. HDW4B TaxID=2714925 RepID=UPI00140D92C2|nr:branched-chain amino acid ABC transporter permease [Diaphorobacter sp. HDW4B]QIL74173.1 branched-chain amino acid ABC transporter permease [Diaphorobacter sp. HDW4B]
MTRQTLKWLLPLLLALAVPWAFEDQGYGIRVLTLVLLFAAMGQAWNIVGGLANQISLGHAAFFGLGAYTSTLLLMRWGISPWIGMIAAMGVAAVAGGLLSLPTMRLRGHYFALATLAFGEVMRAIANTWASVTGGPVGISVPFSEGSLALMQFKSSMPYYYLMLGAVVVTSLIFWLISRSRLGYRLRAVKANPQAAEVIGVNTALTRIQASVISAALMGACGTLYAQFIFFFDPDTVFSLVGISVKVALVCIIGGVGTVAGPLLGALVMIPLEELFNEWLSGRTAGASQLAYGVILIAIILIEPRGLSVLWFRVRDMLKGNHA